MRKNVESRLEKLEANEEQREGGGYDCAIIVMKDGKSRPLPPAPGAHDRCRSW